MPSPSPIASDGRHAELCRAVAQKLLKDSDATVTPGMRYFGLLRDHKDAVAEVERTVYEHWDASPDSPAKQRPEEAKADPILNILTWSGNSCGFPDALLQKFKEGSAHHSAVLALSEKVKNAFPSHFASTTSASGGAGRVVASGGRATGRPDFSIEGGKKPLDLEREVRFDSVAMDALSFPKFLAPHSVRVFCFSLNVDRK